MMTEIKVPKAPEVRVVARVIDGKIDFPGDVVREAKRWGVKVPEVPPRETHGEIVSVPPGLTSPTSEGRALLPSLVFRAVNPGDDEGERSGWGRGGKPAPKIHSVTAMSDAEWRAAMDNVRPAVGVVRPADDAAWYLDGDGVIQHRYVELRPPTIRESKPAMFDYAEDDEGSDLD